VWGKLKNRVSKKELENRVMKVKLEKKNMKVKAKKNRIKMQASQVKVTKSIEEKNNLESKFTTSKKDFKKKKNKAMHTHQYQGKAQKKNKKN